MRIDADMSESSGTSPDLYSAAHLVDAMRAGVEVASGIDASGAAPVVSATAIREAPFTKDLRPAPRGLRIADVLVVGSLDLSDMKLECPISFVRTKFDSTVLMNGVTGSHVTVKNSIAPGLFLQESTLTGSLDLSRSRFESANDAVRLVLDRTAIGGSVFLRETQVFGAVHAVGVTVNGQLDLNKAQIHPLAGMGMGLVLDRLTVHGNIDLRRANIRGVRLVGATVDGQALFRGAVIDAVEGKALSAEWLTVSVLDLRSVAAMRGLLTLAQAQIGTLRVATVSGSDSLPGPLEASGWTLQDLDGPVASDRALVASWLRSAPSGPSFRAQPWQSVADVYERNGLGGDARWLRWTAAKEVTKRVPWPSKFIRVIYGGLVGHGYYPLLSGAWLVGALVLVAALVWGFRGDVGPSDTTRANAAASLHAVPATGTQPSTGAHSITGKTPCTTLGDYPCLRPGLYALDIVLPPAISNGQEDAWQPATASTADRAARVAALGTQRGQDSRLAGYRSAARGARRFASEGLRNRVSFKWHPASMW